jgi:hypothetical protein
MRTCCRRLANANAAQRLCSSLLSLSSFFSVRCRLTPARANFVFSEATPNFVSALSYKLFFIFATANFATMGTFSLLIPEAKGHTSSALFPARPLAKGSPQARWRWTSSAGPSQSGTASPTACAPWRIWIPCTHRIPTIRETMMLLRRSSACRPSSSCVYWEIGPCHRICFASTHRVFLYNMCGGLSTTDLSAPEPSVVHRTIEFRAASTSGLGIPHP